MLYTTLVNIYFDKFLVNIDDTMWSSQLVGFVSIDKDGVPTMNLVSGAEGTRCRKADLSWLVAIMFDICDFAWCIAIILSHCTRMFLSYTGILGVTQKTRSAGKSPFGPLVSLKPLKQGPG